MASSGTEGLQKIKTFQPDLILMDLQMTEMMVLKQKKNQSNRKIRRKRNCDFYHCHDGEFIKIGSG